MPKDKRRDPKVAPEQEPFTSIQTYDPPAKDSEEPDKTTTNATARDDVAIGFERPPVRPREVQ